MISRRGFIFSSTALLTLSGCKLFPGIDLQGQEGDDTFQHPLIDIHCHTFNARDVPVVEFGSETVLREMGLSVLEPFVRPLLRRYAQKAPTIKDERDARGLPKSQAAPAVSPANEVAGAGLQLEKEYEAVILDLKDQAEGKKARTGFTVEEIDAALAELAVQESSTDPVADKAASQNFSKSMSRTDAQKMAARLAAETRAVLTERGGLFAFLANLVRPRVSLTLRAAAFAGPETRIRMITPSMNDYDLWYGIEPNAPNASESMIDQVKFAADVSLMRAPRNVLVNGIVAFDPLRQVYEEVLDPANVTKPLDVVKYAVRERGFVGVKLYPPMGYRPIGNTRDGLRRSRASQIISKIEATALTADPTFDIGRALDAALDELYRFCLNEGVAILAHCSNSQSTFENSGLAANPAHWRQVLDQDPVTLPDGRVLDYSRLRLNLAHGAGIWCAGRTDRKCRDTSSWRSEMFDMLTATKDDAAAYPNLYFDIGDAEGLLEEDERVKIANHIAQAVMGSQRGRQVLTKILYGTDWFMLSKTRRYGGFLKASSGFFRDLSCRLGDGESFEEDMLWRNAARHLGLSTDGATFKRLQYFYRYDQYRSGLLATLAAQLAAAPAERQLQCSPNKA